MTTLTSSPPPLPSNPARLALERKIAVSRWALALELAWPRLWLPVGVVALFFTASLAGLWPLLDLRTHQGVLAGFGLLAALSLLPLLQLRWPSREAGLERLERLSGQPHRPGSSYEDSITYSGPASNQTLRLWAAHQRRLERLIAALRPRPPRPRTERVDPFALRALLVLALIVAGLAAGDAFSDRLMAAFRFGPAPAATVTRLDAWVTPPGFTGRQAILLVDGQQAAAAGATLAGQPIEVPQGSVLTVRAAGPGHAAFAVDVTATAADGKPSSDQMLLGTLKPQANADAETPLSEYREPLANSANVQVTEGGSGRYAWDFQVTALSAPVIALDKPPTRTLRGGLVLDYHVADQYGVASAAASFALADTGDAKPLKLVDGSEIEPLGEAPKMPLKLGKATAAAAKDAVPKDAGPKDDALQSVKGHTSLDLAAHLWAGRKVRMTLTAINRAGLSGTAEPEPFVLPERQFRNPLARALIEQRRKLAASPGDYLDVRYALDALSIAPDRFPLDPGAYLALRTIYRELTETPSKELFQSATDQLWSLAVKLEDGNLSDAEKALKDAEDKLSEALQNGAGDAEIKQLMSQLREALGKYLQSLAEQGKGKQLPQDTQQINPQDLDQMLKRMQQMAETGNKDGAQQMLSQLRDLLDQLQSGKMAGKGKNGQMRQMLDQFGNLIGKQKKLLDDTYKTGRQRNSGDEQGQQGQGRQQGQQGQPGQGQEQGQGGDSSGQGGDLGDLDQRQGDVRNQLDKLMEQLGQGGGQPPEQLGNAGQAMDDARQALQNEDTDGATQSQGKALDQLRKGAEALAQQMRKNQGAQGKNANSDNRDPLGRPSGQDGNDGINEDAELPLDQTNVQRSREIIDELRRRLGEATRPPSELDYLERLLK